MNSKQPYNSGVEEIFSNFGKDPCLKDSCKSICPVGFTCIRAHPPRSGEFRLDFSGCNLKCPFCWTVKRPRLWNPEEIHEKIRCRFRKYHDSDLNVSITYLRITGGEPILNEERANHLLELFNLMDENVSQSKFCNIWKKRKSPLNLVGRKNIKIQTNGITIPKLINTFISELSNFRNLSFTFEVSLKGTNPSEFYVLSGGFPGEIFFEQIQAIKELIRYENQGYPIFARGILGICHSEQYDLVFPNNGKMMLNPSVEFIEVVKELMCMPRNQERFYVEPLRFTEQMKQAERDCKKIGIFSQSEIGKNIKPGKKVPIKSTYLWTFINAML
ncbi:hypothetical protein ES702_03898 [subsurface metagenome]